MEFLSDGQAAAFGRFAGPPSREQLERYFFLDDADRGLVGKRRGDYNRLGFALQLTTVRFLGTFLADPVEVPCAVVEFLGSQLEVEDLSCVKAYAARLPTQHEHAREIRKVCGYRDFAEAEEELRAWLAARVWATSEGPSVTFDRATAWLVEHKVLLPGSSVLARAVTSVREASSARLWQALGARASTASTAGLERMLEVGAGSRVSTLERLRRAPTRLSSPAMVAALERLLEIRGLGASEVDLSELPAGRVNELARYGMAAKAQTISRLSPDRRAATLLAVAKHLETVANDDALDLFDGLAAQLIARSAKAGDRERLGRLPRLAEASAQLALAMGVLLEADEDLTLSTAVDGHRDPRPSLRAGDSGQGRGGPWLTRSTPTTRCAPSSSIVTSPPGGSCPCSPRWSASRRPPGAARPWRRWPPCRSCGAARRCRPPRSSPGWSPLRGGAWCWQNPTRSTDGPTPCA